MSLWHPWQTAKGQWTTMAAKYLPASSLQRDDILFLSELYQQREHHNMELPDFLEIKNRTFKLPKRKTERTQCKLNHRTRTIVSRRNWYIDFKTSKGLKNRGLNFMWKFVNVKYLRRQLCSRQLCCDCPYFSAKWAILWANARDPRILTANQQQHAEMKCPCVLERVMKLFLVQSLQLKTSLENLM